MLDGRPFFSGDALSHIWYHLQIYINTGKGNSPGRIQPLDWNYQPLFIRAHDSFTGRPAFTRWMLSWDVGMTRLARERGITHHHGFNHDLHGVYRISREMEHGSQQGEKLPANHLEIYMDQLLKAYAHTVWELDRIYVQEGDMDDWLRGDGPGGYRNYWGYPDDVPQYRVRGALGRPPERENRAASNMYTFLRNVTDRFDLTPETIDALTAWGAYMWAEPRGDESWSDIQGSGPPDPLESEPTAPGTPSSAEPDL